MDNFDYYVDTEIDDQSLLSVLFYVPFEVNTRWQFL